MKNKSIKIPENQILKKNVSTAVVVASLEKRAAPMFKKLKAVSKVTSQEDLDLVGEQIKLLKELKSIGDEEEADLASGQHNIIKEAEATIAKIDKHFEPFRVKVAETETTYKNLILDWLASNNKKLEKITEKFEAGKLSVKQYASQTAGLQAKSGAAKIRGVTKLEIFDEKKIPREYLVPNENAIKAAINNGVKVPGCKMVKQNSIAI